MQLCCKEVTKISFTYPSVSYPRNGVTWEQEMLIFRFYPKKGPFFSRWEDNEKNFGIFRRKSFLEKKSEKKVKNDPFFEKWPFSSILGFKFSSRALFQVLHSQGKSPYVLFLLLKNEDHDLYLCQIQRFYWKSGYFGAKYQILCQIEFHYSNIGGD